MILITAGNMVAALVFIDLPTIAGSLLAVYAVVIITGESKTFVMGVNAVLSQDYSISDTNREKAIQLFKLLKETVIYASLLYAMSGFVFLLILSDPGDWRPMLAISILSIFYGALVNVVFICPAIAILKKRTATS